jgi:glycosyltransferase involved in cell wall biosynthesis
LSPPRLVLVTRRFWPLVGGAERTMADLAVELAARGSPVVVLTARWDAAWPAQINFAGVPVVRLAQPGRRGWGTFRYLRALADWLRARRDDYDLVYVSMLRHDAYAALGAVDERVPVVVRAHGAGAAGDCAWHQQARFGRCMRRRCRRATALIAPCPLVRQELLAAGYAREQIHDVPCGVPIPPPRSPEAKLSARRVLAETQPALMVPIDTPLAVYAGRLHAAQGLKQLVAAWRLVVARRPTARLWMAGDGPQRQALQDHIDFLGLHGRVVCTGTFDQVDDLLTAADLFVRPAYEEGLSRALLEAMAAGLPIVASDVPGHREAIADGRHGRLVPAERPDALAAAVVQLFEQPELGAQWGAAARERAAAEFSLSQMTDRHLALFEKLLLARPAAAGRMA